MPKKEPITLDGASFTSIKSAQDHVRNLMKEIGVCASVKERDAQYYGVQYYERVLAIARRHPNSSKLDGVCDFAIAYNKLSRSALEVIIIKEDGTTEDISLLNKCITCKLDTQKASLASAFRYSIDDQIKAFRKQATATQCELCNCVLSCAFNGALNGALSGLVHVDHTVHFEQLVADFLSTYGKPLPTTFVNSPDGTHRHAFAPNDQQVSNAFYDYHKEHALLRLVCSSCNLSRPKWKQQP